MELLKYHKKYLIPIIAGFVILVAVPSFSKAFSHKQFPINENKLSGEYNAEQKTGVFHSGKMDIPEKSGVTKDLAAVLGSKSDKKRIEINLSEQKLYAYEGNDKKYSFKVSTGKWGRTPTGEFRIWTKLRYTLMAGGSEALGTYYYLPNVPFTMYFHNDSIPKSRGYGIHGTYWHDNFGHPMSHGCINMKTEEAEKLFYWANPSISEGQHSVYADGENTGTRVIIYGETPES